MTDFKRKLTTILNYKLRINGIVVHACSMLYIYISIFLFLLGWVKPIFSIPTCIILLIALVVYIEKTEQKLKNIKPIYINMKMFLLLLFSIFTLSWIFGWTGFATQSEDWWKHNSVLADLTTHSYPVYYQNGTERSMLTYYLGQYIFPAFVGKIFSSIKVSFILNGIWASFGLLLALFGIFKVTKSDTSKKQLIALVITILFSTCLVLSRFLGKLFITTRDVGYGHWFMMDNDYILQYSNNIVLLRWVMPQCIIPWIVFTILYENPFEFENYALLCLPILFYSSFSFVAIAIIILALLITGILKNKNILQSFKKIFSLSNISICLTLGLILLLYFAGNVFTDKPESLAFVSFPGSDILVYVIFIMSFLPYTFILYKFNKKNIFYWLATGILLVLPFFHMGLYNDFCMRVSIIPLFTYMLLSIHLLNSENTLLADSNSTEIVLQDKFNLTKFKYLLLVPLIIGGISSSADLNIAVEAIQNRFLYSLYPFSLEICANREFAEIQPDNSDMIFNYFTYDLDNHFFYKYLARTEFSIDNEVRVDILNN